MLVSQSFNCFLVEKKITKLDESWNKNTAIFDNCLLNNQYGFLMLNLFDKSYVVMTKADTHRLDLSFCVRLITTCWKNWTFNKTNIVQTLRIDTGLVLKHSPYQIVWLQSEGEQYNLWRKQIQL